MYILIYITSTPQIILSVYAEAMWYEYEHYINKERGVMEQPDNHM